MRIEVEHPAEVVKEAFWLAWQACGGPFGMGVFRDNPGAGKDQVWDQAFGRGDYPGGNRIPGFANKPGDVYGDYVFGRMMKLCIKWDDSSVTVDDSEPRPDYQGWSRKYPSYAALIEAAVVSLKTGG